VPQQGGPAAIARGQLAKLRSPPGVECVDE